MRPVLIVEVVEFAGKRRSLESCRTYAYSSKIIVKDSIFFFTALS